MVLSLLLTAGTDGARDLAAHPPITFLPPERELGGIMRWEIDAAVTF